MLSVVLRYLIATGCLLLIELSPSGSNIFHLTHQRLLQDVFVKYHGLDFIIYSSVQAIGQGDIACIPQCSGAVNGRGDANTDFLRLSGYPVDCSMPNAMCREQ